MGAQRALGRSRASLDDLDATLIALVDRVTRRMRAAGRVGRTVVLRLRFDDFSRAARAHTLAEATAETPAVLAALRGLLAAAAPEIERRGITLVGIALTNLEDADAVQLALPLDARPLRESAAGTPGAVPLAAPPAQRLDAAVDAVRDLYGTEAITRGVLLGRDLGHEMPLLPD